MAGVKVAWRRAAACVLLGACSFQPGASVTIDASADASPDARADASPDAPADAMTQIAAVSAATVGAASNSSTLIYSLTIPAGTSRFLLVSVQLGTNCPSGLVPNTLSVTYNGVALTPITAIVGTPCGITTTRSEQWQLIAPATGMHDIVVTLAADAKSVHSGAMAFTGIDQLAPVRSTATASGTGTSSSVTVASAVGDLVVNTVGQGNSITAPGAGQTERFLHNVDTSNTLNNSAGSMAPGAASVTMTWTFGASDEWQTISSSLRP